MEPAAAAAAATEILVFFDMLRQEVIFCRWFERCFQL